MNIVISDPKAGKAYGKKTEEPIFLGNKIGDEVALDVLGLSGFKAKIAGGSDKQGFPMKKTFPGSARKKIMISKGTGFRPARKGERKRISVRGKVVSDEIAQLNLAITQYGSTSLETLLGKKSAGVEKKAEGKEAEVKEPGAKETKAEESGKKEKPAGEKTGKTEEVKEKQGKKVPEEKKEAERKEGKKAEDKA